MKECSKVAVVAGGASYSSRAKEYIFTICSKVCIGTNKRHPLLQPLLCYIFGALQQPTNFSICRTNNIQRGVSLRLTGHNDRASEHVRLPRARRTRSSAFRRRVLGCWRVPPRIYATSRSAARARATRSITPPISTNCPRPGRRCRDRPAISHATAPSLSLQSRARSRQEEF
jgi:hypothetical protein